MSDQALSDTFYHTVDTFLRLLGADQVSRTDVFFRISRAAIGTPVDYSEIQRILADIHSFAAWYTAWQKSADRFVRLAQEAEQSGHHATAGEHALRAALLYHFAQLFTRPEDPRRTEGQQKRVLYFRKAAPLLTPRVEPVWIPHGELQMPGYLLLPVGAGHPPVVIMLPGANSVKEELHHWGLEFYKRGIAALMVDGPGQGELSVGQGGPPMDLRTYPQAVSAAIDYLETRPEVDAQRVTVWGQSTGGHLAMRAAAQDSRIRAAVSLGGGYDFRLEITPTTPADVWEEARDLYGLPSFEAVVPYLRQYGSLRGLLEQVRCPLLVIHGAQDNIVAMEEIEQIRQEATGSVTVQVYPDGNHSVCNRNLEMGPAMADWVADQMGITQPSLRST